MILKPRFWWKEKTCKHRNDARLLLNFLRTAAQANATTEDEPEKVAAIKHCFEQGCRKIWHIKLHPVSKSDNAHKSLEFNNYFNNPRCKFTLFIGGVWLY